MTHSGIFNILKSAGIPFAYHHFSEPQKLPFGAWGVSGEPDLLADDTHYAGITSAYVELYSEKKDQKNENKIKKVLSDNEIDYAFEYEAYIESEKMFVVRWSIQFIGG